MAAILKSNEAPTAETSEPLLAEEPRKAHVSRRAEPEEVEQLKETSVSRNTKSVPLGRTEAGLMDAVRFSGSPGWKNREIISSWDELASGKTWFYNKIAIFKTSKIHNSSQIDRGG